MIDDSPFYSRCGQRPRDSTRRTRSSYCHGANLGLSPAPRPRNHSALFIRSTVSTMES